MRLVILGGNAFVSRACVEVALARGHAVTCVARGLSGEFPSGAEVVRWDRDEPAPVEVNALADGADAVIDVARLPHHVAHALDALAAAHWVFVSSISVYSDLSGPPTLDAIHDPLWSDAPAQTPEEYGAQKVACERLIAERARTSTIVRPGLIVGPGDDTGRFTSWPRRVREAARDAEDSRFLAPLPRETPVQWIDVADLATWLVELAEQRAIGTFDGIGPAMPREQFVADLIDLEPTESQKASAEWVDAETLIAHDVRPWMGPRSISLWVPDPEWSGFLARDAEPALAAGLRPRSLRDTVAGLRDAGEHGEGLERPDERAVLVALGD